MGKSMRAEHLLHKTNRPTPWSPVPIMRSPSPSAATVVYDAASEAAVGSSSGGDAYDKDMKMMMVAVALLAGCQSTPDAPASAERSLEDRFCEEVADVACQN